MGQNMAEITGKRQIKFMETVLRDGHQSLIATRMKTEEMIPILETLDAVGYHALECWGGATFDASVRFLNEDPWERLRTIKKRVKSTKLQMLLRGQNLLGYKHYADDMVDEFVGKSIENGIDIIRIFDAFNDTRNLESAIRACKKHGGHAQGTLSFTISPVHTADMFVKLIQELADMGADSVCIKDMAGLLDPYGTYALVK
jgi:oxaloacetate decarboxylase alpha subunit